MLPFLIALLQFTSQFPTVYGQSDEVPDIPMNPDGTVDIDRYKEEQYEDLLKVLKCIFVPIGVLGFYVWFAIIVTAAFSLYSARKKLLNDKGKDTKVTALLFGLAQLLFTIFQLYSNSKTIRECGNFGAFGAIRAATVLTILGSIFGMIGSVMLAFWWERRSIQKWILAMFSCSLLFLLIGGPAYFAAVAANINYLRPADYQGEGVGYGVVFVSLLPCIAFAIYIVVLFCTGLPDSQRDVFKSRWILILCLTIVMVSLLLCAFGNIVMGNEVGDKWGKYLLKKWIGAVDAVFAGALPVADGLLLTFNLL